MSQCRLGAMITARGQSTRRWQNAIAVAIGVGGSKIVAGDDAIKTSAGQL
jgi:hypothetical protein